MPDEGDRQSWTDAGELGRLTRDLAGEGPVRRREAAEEPRGMAEPEATPLLVTALQDQDGEARSQAARALGEQRDRRAFEPLVAALGDDLAAPSAALALMRLGDDRAIRPLIDCLDPAKSLRLQFVAVRALAGLGGAGVLDRLIEVAGDGDRDPGVRQAAQVEIARLSRGEETGPNPMLLWALGVALIAAALVAAATIGPLAGIPLVAGALIALLARVRATRGTSVGEDGGWGFDSPGWGSGGADGGGGDGGGSG